MLAEILRILTFRAGHNTSMVLLGTTLLGIAAGVVGVFTLLRKRALLGDALAHATLPGVAGAFLAAVALGHAEAARSLPVLLAGAAAGGLAGLGLVQLLRSHGRLADDAAIGVALSVLFGVGVVLLSAAQGSRAGTQGGLSHFIYGQTAAMTARDAWVMASVAAGVALVSLAMLKELGLVCFDERFARTIGRPVGLADAAILGMTLLVVVVGLQAVGLLLIISLLVIPAVSARFWTERLWRMTVLAGGLGGLAGYAGGAASAAMPRLPAGGVIVLGAGVIFLVSLLCAPRRGVLAAAWRGARLRMIVARDHALRGAYERLEAAGRLEPGVALGGALPGGSLAAWSLRWSGLLVKARDGGEALTPAGLYRAEALTRNHRLWERYLVTCGNSPTHVDRSADMVEHALSAEIVARLEEDLRREGRLPGERVESVHPL